MAIVIKPPHPLVFDKKLKSVFLAGSIEMGKAENWQVKVEKALQTYPVIILNPRREAWDSSWEQNINNPLFCQQVEWELEAQEQTNIIAMYFAPETKAPITLLELGLFARSQKLIVCCPDGYFRKGNVDIVCDKYKIPTTPSLSDLINQIKNKL
jgi:hypothetical protein